MKRKESPDPQVGTWSMSIAPPRSWKNNKGIEKGKGEIYGSIM